MDTLIAIIISMAVAFLSVTLAVRIRPLRHVMFGTHVANV
jgi:hypothetical protein